MYETVPCRAGERMPHGSPVRIKDGACFLERDDGLVQGVTKRPWITFATQHEKGEQLLVQTSGPIKSERDGLGRLIVLDRGRIAHAA